VNKSETGVSADVIPHLLGWCVQNYGRQPRPQARPSHRRRGARRRQTEPRP